MAEVSVRSTINFRVFPFLFVLLFLAALPRLTFAKSISQTDQRIDIEGTVEASYADDFIGKKAQLFYHVRTSDGQRFELRFEKTSERPALVTGDRIKINGARKESDGSLTMLSSGGAAGGGAPGSTVTITYPRPPSVGPTFGAQKTIVMLVRFSDGSILQGMDAASVRTALDTASNFFRENSFNQTWLSGAVNPSASADIYGYFTIPQSSSVCDTTTTATLAEQAATAAGVDLTPYTRRVYVFGSNNACPWGGLGWIGGYVTKAYIQSGTSIAGVLIHELGHNFGLNHAHSQPCTTGSCTVVEYGDEWDAMGSSSSNHFNASHKEYLGWLNYNLSPPIRTVRTSGDYFLGPYELNNQDPKGLKIFMGDQDDRYMYVEYRTPRGFDSDKTPGVLLHTNSGGLDSRIIDIAPTTLESIWALNPRQNSYTDPTGGITVTLNSRDNDGASVNVSLTCVLANPEVVISPPSQILAPTGTNYTVTIKNKNSAGCAATRFNLAGIVPNGWTAALNAAWVNLISGASISKTVTITAPKTTPEGSYAVSVSATSNVNPAYAGMGTATAVIK